MATVTRKNVLNLITDGVAQWGNHSSLKFSLLTTAAGFVQDSDASAALAINDKVRLGVLPAGTDLTGSLAALSTTFTASSTFDIGFEYVDGVDSGVVPQNATYFYAALNAATLARTAQSNVAVRPVTLPKDAYLIVTNKGAVQAKAGVLDLIVSAILNGTP